MSEDNKTEARALVPVEPMPMTERGLALRSFDELQRFCKAAIASGYFKGVQDVAQAVVKVQYGAELGIPPISAMQGVYIVDGKPSLSAGLIAARIKSSGRYDYRVTEMSDRRCALTFWQGGHEVGPSEFTLEDAKAAGVAQKDVWKRYPRNMLFARAISNGARWYCPDVFMGSVYTPEELGGSETIEVPRAPQPQPQPQSSVPQATRPVSPPAVSSPAVAPEPPDDEPPPHGDADAGPPPETEAQIETPWEHARNAGAVKAAEEELGAKVESVKPPKNVTIYDRALAAGLRSKADVDALIAAQFDGRAFRALTSEEKKQAVGLVEAEGARRKTEGASIVRTAKEGQR